MVVAHNARAGDEKELPQVVGRKVDDPLLQSIVGVFGDGDGLELDVVAVETVVLERGPEARLEAMGRVVEYRLIGDGEDLARDRVDKAALCREVELVHDLDGAKERDVLVSVAFEELSEIGLPDSQGVTRQSDDVGEMNSGIVLGPDGRQERDDIEGRSVRLRLAAVFGI